MKKPLEIAILSFFSADNDWLEINTGFLYRNHNALDILKSKGFVELLCHPKNTTGYNLWHLLPKGRLRLKHLTEEK